MLPKFPNDFFTCSTGDAEVLLEEYNRTVLEMWCETCKYYIKDVCLNDKIFDMIDTEPSSLHGFYPPADFYCKFFEAKED